MTIKRVQQAVPFRTVAIAVMLLSMAVWAFPSVHAASLTSLSLTLSTSEPSVSATHTFQYTIGTATTSRGVALQYCDSGSGTCTAPAGLSLDAAAIDAAGTNDDFDGWTLATTTDTIQITDATGSATSSPTLAFSGITNPSGSVPTTFFVRITTYSDTGLSTVVDGTSQVSSAVVPKISVTGTQDAILEMTVGVVNALVTVGDAADNEIASGLDKRTTATSTATSLPFGTFKPLTTSGEESKAVAQTINGKTNGTTGYTASVQGGASAMTANGGGDTISYVGADTDWNESATSGFGVNAQGGEAVTATFGTVGGDNLDFESMASSLTLASSATPTVGANTTVVFRVQVAVTQAAGDYSGDVNYTVLPGF